MGKIRELFLHKDSMIDVWQIPKYVSVIYNSDWVELYL